MHWGHKVSSKEGQQDATREEYNAAFGVVSPEPPEIPDAIAHVWAWFWELSARRAPGFDSITPLSYSDIYHWSALTRTQITPSEIAILIQTDDAFLQQMSRERRDQHERETQRNKDGK